MTDVREICDQEIRSSPYHPCPIHFVFVEFQEHRDTACPRCPRACPAAYVERTVDWIRKLLMRVRRPSPHRTCIIAPPRQLKAAAPLVQPGRTKKCCWPVLRRAAPARCELCVSSRAFLSNAPAKRFAIPGKCSQYFGPFRAAVYSRLRRSECAAHLKSISVPNARRGWRSWHRTLMKVQVIRTGFVKQ